MTPARGHRYPIWNTRVVVLITLPVIVTITVLVFVLSDRSVFVESQITLAIISLCLFLFLTTGLYRGVRLERPGKDELDRSIMQFESRAQGSRSTSSDFFGLLFSFGPPDLSHVKLPHIDLKGVPDAGDHLVGCLVTLVLWTVVLALLAILLWMLAQFIAALPVFAVVLYWVFYRALRVVFARSKACRGKLLRSMEYGLLYTLLYTGWIFALLWIARILIPVA
jgi:hypothetical protein